MHSSDQGLPTHPSLRRLKRIQWLEEGRPVLSCLSSPTSSRLETPSEAVGPWLAGMEGPRAAVTHDHTLGAHSEVGTSPHSSPGWRPGRPHWAPIKVWAGLCPHWRPPAFLGSQPLPPFSRRAAQPLPLWPLLPHSPTQTLLPPSFRTRTPVVAFRACPGHHRHPPSPGP